MDTKREIYQEKAKAKYDQLNAKIDGLKARYDEAKADAKLKVKTQFDDLSMHQKTVTHQFEEMKNAGQDAWQDIKDGLEESFDTLEKTFTEAADRLKEVM